ncbi:MAG: rRNA cytosine-C5-methyltransferase, partial [Actinobacteria bacterium]|nr:rRNA cytosine-C5-methyltransferase [Actinomycetota bacterium]
PCTGLGALRRRPESRWRKQPSDIRALSKLQSELLIKAGELVRIGGLIAYATCSPHIAETDVIIDSFLAKHPDFSLVPLEHALPMLALPDETTRLRLRPDFHGTDGMYLAILRRNA